MSITSTFECEVTHLPRSGQLTIETVAKSFARRGKVYEPEPEAIIGRFSNDQRYTYLRVQHEGRRIELTVLDPLVDEAVKLTPGTKLKVKVEITGQEPHFRMCLLKFNSVTWEDAAT